MKETGATEGLVGVASKFDDPASYAEVFAYPISLVNAKLRSPILHGLRAACYV